MSEALHATEIGVVIVTFNSADVITECLESLVRADHDALRIVVCDNASSDETITAVRSWAHQRHSDFIDIAVDTALDHPLPIPRKFALFRSALNQGFASGVNLGLKALLPCRQVRLFWILNPDCVVTPQAASAYVRAQALGPFSLMGGRILYRQEPSRIQSDGGRVNRWTGLCKNVNQGMFPNDAKRPDPLTLDFISGANAVASREFIDRVGLMPETYFLYYEEVEWAFWRGDLPLRFCSEAVVYHHGGTAIGTGSVNRLASPFANFFNFRNRMKFMWRCYPYTCPIAYLFSLLKVGQLLLRGAWHEAFGAACGLHWLPPPPAVFNHLDLASAEVAFRRLKRS